MATGTGYRNETSSEHNDRVHTLTNKLSNACQTISSCTCTRAAQLCEGSLARVDNIISDIATQKELSVLSFQM